MTRDEFFEQIGGWGDLLEFDRENDFGFFSDIFPGVELDDRVQEVLGSAVGEMSWEELRDYLSDIPTGWDYYRDRSDDEWFGFYGVDEDLDTEMEEFAAWMDDNGYWDDPDEAEDADEDEPAEDPAFERPDITLEGLVEICRADVPHLSARDAARIVRTAIAAPDVQQEPEDGWHEFEPGKFYWNEMEANP